MTRKKPVAPDTRDQEIVKLREQLARQELNQQALLQHLGRQAAAPGRPNTALANVAPGQLFVGVRNVSAYTVGVRNTVTTEPDLHLHAPLPDGSNAIHTVAIVSYAWWQYLRKGREYGRGILVRDDSVLGTNYEAAPADEPADCHPDHDRNLVADAEAWLAARTEDAIAADVQRMTATEPLRKLEGLYFLAHERLMEKHAALPWADRKRRVERDLPSKLKHMRAVVVDRLREIAPNPDPNILPAPRT